MSDSFGFPALPATLPPGRTVSAHGGRWDGRPVLWATRTFRLDAAHLWSQLYDQHTETGLYPLLLDVLKGDDLEQRRPWHSGELGYSPVETIDALDPDEVLQRGFPATQDPSFDPFMPRQWPGLAASGTAGDDPDTTARWLAQELAQGRPLLVGLVPAARGADTVALCGWKGAVNYTNFPEELAVVLRSWEDRFGARLIMLGFDTLHLSVAAPPRTHQHALQVAAEHAAFCGDNLADDTLDTYAACLVNLPGWQFWWD